MPGIFPVALQLIILPWLISEYHLRTKSYFTSLVGKFALRNCQSKNSLRLNETIFEILQILKILANSGSDKGCKYLKNKDLHKAWGGGGVRIILVTQPHLKIENEKSKINAQKPLPQALQPTCRQTLYYYPKSSFDCKYRFFLRKKQG
jgi:hypothetical protein